MPPVPHLLIASGVWPYVTANREAANVVAHEIALHLARADRFKVSYAYVNSAPAEIPAAAEPEIAQLRAAGVRFLNPVIVEPAPVGANGKVGS